MAWLGLLTTTTSRPLSSFLRNTRSPSRAEIYAQLEALRDGDWEEWELQGARSSLCSGLRSTHAVGLPGAHLLHQAAGGVGALVV